MIVVPPPGVGQHLRLRHTEKDLTVKQFISELTVKAFDVAVLPGTARFDKQGLHTQFCGHDRTALATKLGPIV